MRKRRPMRKKRPQYELRAIPTDDGVEIIKRPRRKNPKYQKLDLNVPIEAEAFRCRKDALIKKLRALQ